MLDGNYVNWYGPSKLPPEERGPARPWDRPMDKLRLSSRYGKPRPTKKNPKRKHSGEDYAIPIGTSVRAVDEGTVVAIWRDDGKKCDGHRNGSAVSILHPDGSRSSYVHLSRVDVPGGTFVRRGQQIGLSGNTGCSTGPHLHISAFNPNGQRFAASTRWGAVDRVADRAVPTPDAPKWTGTALMLIFALIAGTAALSAWYLLLRVPEDKKKQSPKAKRPGAGRLALLNGGKTANPFPNQHAARQREPSDFQEGSFRRFHPPGFPAGVDTIIGRPHGKRTTKIQSIRFDAAKWTPGESRQWLQDHNYRTGMTRATRPGKAA